MFEDLLGSTARARIIGALLVSGEGRLHLRALARAAGGSISSAQREVERLETMGLVTTQKDPQGRRQVSLVFEHPFTAPLGEMLAADPVAQYRARTGALPDFDPDVAHDLGEWIDAIVVAFDPIRIVLFGSHARGTAQPDSDVDLLVVLPHMRSKGDAMVEIKSAVGPRTRALDVIPTDERDIERQRGRRASVVNVALSEGKVVYERPA